MTYLPVGGNRFLFEPPFCRRSPAHRGCDRMYFLALAAGTVLLIVMIMMNRKTHRTGDIGGTPHTPMPQRTAFAKLSKHTVAFISNGKLFYQAPGDELRELQSPHVRTVMERMERSRQLHGWKEGTAFGRSFTGRNLHDTADGVRIQATSAQFAAHDRVL